MFIVYTIAALALLLIFAIPVITHHQDKRAAALAKRILTMQAHHNNAMEWRRVQMDAHATSDNDSRRGYTDE